MGHINKWTVQIIIQKTFFLCRECNIKSVLPLIKWISFLGRRTNNGFLSNPNRLNTQKCITCMYVHIYNI